MDFPRINWTARKITITAMVLIAVVVAWGSASSISEQKRAVLTQFGKFVEVRGPGLNWKWPLIQSFNYYDTTVHAFTQEKVNTYTVDNQELDALFTVNYRILPQNVERIFKTVPDYEERLKSLSVDRFKAEVGRINVTEIAQKRGEVRDRILEVLKENAETLFGLDVTDFQITSIDYNKTFRDANNAASVAKAKVEQATQEKLQAQIDAEKAKIIAAGKANATEEEARGAANARLLAAKAEAEAIRIQGDATASAISAQAIALGQNPALVELEKAKKWDGKLPSSMLSNVMPFMNVDQTGTPRQTVTR